MAKQLVYEKDKDGEKGSSSPQQPKTFEDILENVGGFGRFQFFLLLFILFYEIPAGFLAFVPVFVGGTPREWKCDKGNETVVMSIDQVCTSCPKESRFAPYYSIVAEWGLICDQSWVVPTITSIQMFGMLFGNTIPPQLSDWYGRKTTFLGLIVLMTIGEALSAVSTNPYIFTLARFICGVGLAGYFSLNGIYTMEFLTPKWRQLGGCLGPLGEGLMFLGILAYFIRPWRLLLWVTTFPFVVTLFIFPFLPESPRWLLRQRRYDEVEGVLRYIAKINGRKLNKSDVAVMRELGEKESSNNPSSGGGVRYSYLDLFRKKSMRFKTLLFIGIWFCWAFTYFGLSYNIRNFGVDPYAMTVLMGLADAIGFRAALLVNNRLGRRKALVAFTGTSALFFIPVGVAMLFTQDEGFTNLKIFLIVATLLGKLCVAGARSAVRVFTVESYPVAVRTMGFGISRVSATFGGMAAPQIAYLGSQWPSLPLFAFGILGFLGSLLSLLLKETSGQPLQDDELKEDGGGGGKVGPSVFSITQNHSIPNYNFNNDNNKSSQQAKGKNKKRRKAAKGKRMRAKSI